MSSAVNYESVLSQMAMDGLLIHDGSLQLGRMCRFKVDGEKGKPGWCYLQEIQLEGSGEIVIVGSYGVWHGDDNNAQKIEIRSRLTSKEEKAAIRKMLRENRRKAEAQRRREAEKASIAATHRWKLLKPTGNSDYLERKAVQAHGLRFTEKGALAVPMCDGDGKIWGLQFILSRSGHAQYIKKTGRDKEFWPMGLTMRGMFHTIGAPRSGGIVLVAEGYATAATLHEATGHPILVTFTANNLLPAAEALAKKHKGVRFLFCADDDHVQKCKFCKHEGKTRYTPVAEEVCIHCEQPHGASNAGVNQATIAAAAVGGAWVKPAFAEPRPRDRKSITDFNDLHIAEGLHVVRQQIDIAIEYAGWGKAEKAARGTAAQGGGAGAVPSYMTVDNAVDRFSLVYGVKDTVFDHSLFKLVPKSCMLDVLPDRAWGDFKRHPDLRIFDIDEVGFDPGGNDPSIRCNLYRGWPTQADTRGSCEKLKELLAYMCSGEEKPREVLRWVWCWLAYPIQNPGAKMKTALVVHGGQGVGKNMFFEAVMAIYGPYGKVVGQDALEDTFNDWQSGKLFLLANEVVARQELFHTKNRLKGIITEDMIRIRAPFMGSRWERNHMNCVFLANELQPVVLDPDDRRFMVIWTPPKLEPDFYRAVLDEIADGGIEALHHELLNVDLSDFNPGTPPLQTNARLNLIERSKESPDRFIEAWIRGELDMPCMACSIDSLYKVYESWIRSEGERFPYTKNKFSSHIVRADGIWSDKPGRLPRKPVWQGENVPAKPVVVVIPESDQKPSEESWQSWLADRLRKFEKARTKASERSFDD